jgi:hypothetical protein
MFEVRDGFITRVDQYEDAPRVGAFKRMARQSAPSEIESDRAALLSSRQKSGAGA